MLVDALRRADGIGVSDVAVGAASGRHVLKVALLRKVVGIGRIHPPAVHAGVPEALHVVPVDVARDGREVVAELDAARIVLARRPDVLESARGPRLEREEEPALGKLLVGLRLRTEALPDRDDHLGVHLVGALDHPVAALPVAPGELHRVPEVVLAPVLPVLYDAVERDSVLAVAREYTDRLLGRFVALLRLPETVRPAREHRDVPRERAHLRDASVARLAVEEVVVDAFARLALERERGRIVVNLRGARVVPPHGVAPLAREIGNAVADVAGREHVVLATLVEFAVLEVAEPVEPLVRAERKLLAWLQRLVLAVRRLLELGRGRLREQLLALRVPEADGARLLVEANLELARGPARHVALLHRHGTVPRLCDARLEGLLERRAGGRL